MERIGFIAVGSVGNPMARCIFRAGYKLTVCDKNPQSLDMFKTMGTQTTHINPTEERRK